MRRPALCLVTLFLVAVPAFADSPRDALVRTSPQHMAPALKMPFEQAVVPPMFPNDEFPSGILVRRIPDSMTKLGKIDKTLSEACQLGVFRELKPSKMIAVAKDATLGAAFGHGLGLVDPRKLADSTKVYYFYHGSTSFCMVRVEDNWDPRHARSR